MEIGYQEALEQLTNMFEGFDQETIKTVLAANDGHVERTIEDLLKMSPESGNNPRPQDDDDDNLFAEPNPSRNNNKRNDDLFGIDDEAKGNRFEDLGIFQDNNQRNQGDSYAKELQEQEDAAIAYRLQKEYIKQEQELERQARTAQRTQNRPAPSGGMNYGGGEWDFSQPANNQAPRNQMNNPPQQNHSQANQGSGEKKKVGFMSKVKTGFNNIFNKKGKATKGTAQNAGNYAEIDNLEEHEVYNFSNAEAPQRNNGFQNNNLMPQNNHQYDEEPMQLADILNPRGIENLDSDGEDDKRAPKYPVFENNFGNNYDNNNNNHNNNNEGGRVSNEHFGFNWE